jgi:hypothetical protein
MSVKGKETIETPAMGLGRHCNRSTRAVAASWRDTAHHGGIKMAKIQAAVTKEIQSTNEIYDGHPHDVIRYLEAKLILKPDRFTSVESFREFGRIVAHTTKQVGKVDFIPDAKAGQRPGIREIVFLDTPDFAFTTAPLFSADE